MTERYLPSSPFLNTVIAGEAPLRGELHGEANLRRLIDMTRDPELANRDWATMLLAQERVDTAEVRQALIVAAQDEEAIVRAEAISGLASRNRTLALPFLRAELAGATVTMPLLEAAALVADASLADDLRAFCLQSGNRFLDELAAKALAACEAAGAATGA